jgi:hypothetical protein
VAVAMASPYIRVCDGTVASQAPVLLSAGSFLLSRQPRRYYRIHVMPLLIILTSAQLIYSRSPAHPLRSLFHQNYPARQNNFLFVPVSGGKWRRVCRARVYFHPAKFMRKITNFVHHLSSQTAFCQLNVIDPCLNK